MQDMKKVAKLSAKERDLIAIWYGQQVSIRQIAKKLGRYPSTILREIRRNSFRDRFNHQEYYVAIHAQSRTNQRKSLAGKRHPLKNPQVYAYVLAKLKQGWSPELIAGRLRKTYGGSIICHETIYRFIYNLDNQEKMLWENLPWKRIKRKKKHGRIVHRGKILFRVSIGSRPEEINQRLVFGHWEGDTLEGKRINNDGIHTEVERLSRKIMAKKVDQITSEKTSQVQEEMFANLPAYARQSTTLDNGRENHLHFRLKLRLGMKTFFADPYSSWQRGTNEFHNGLLRRYLPKGTDFSKITQEELNDIVGEINNRPRKVLNYNTPNEVFKAYLKRESVAIQVRM
jgi:IS30 family transposase